MASGAQAIVEMLEAEGAEVCFGLPGVHNLALWAALRESSIRLIGVRHEQAAAYAADGYARATGQVGGGARDAGAEVSELATRLGAPVLTTYGAAGVLAPGHPCLVGLPPHVEAAGRLWDEADVVVAVGSDLDGVQTQNFLQPQPPTLIALGL